MFAFNVSPRRESWCCRGAGGRSRCRSGRPPSPGRTPPTTPETGHRQDSCILKHVRVPRPWAWHYSVGRVGNSFAALPLLDWVHKYLTWSISASQRSRRCLARRPGDEIRKTPPSWQHQFNIALSTAARPFKPIPRSGFLLVWMSEKNNKILRPEIFTSRIWVSLSELLCPCGRRRGVHFCWCYKSPRRHGQQELRSWWIFYITSWSKGKWCCWKGAPAFPHSTLPAGTSSYGDALSYLCRGDGV